MAKFAIGRLVLNFFLYLSQSQELDERSRYRYVMCTGLSRPLPGFSLRTNFTILPIDNAAVIIIFQYRCLDSLFLERINVLFIKMHRN